MPWTFYNSSGEALIADGAMTIANNTNNRVVTATGADPASLNGESALTFDGTTLTIAGQIAFPATQSASAGANTLDDYEEGAWTPTILDNTLSASESQAYHTQTGHYIKTGRMVYCFFTLHVSSFGSLTTSEGAKIGGLPYTSINFGATVGGGSLYIATNLAITATSGVVIDVPANVAYARFQEFDATTGTSTLLLSEVSSDGNLLGTFVYEAAN